MEIIAYRIFSSRDCYILKTNSKIEIEKYGTANSVYLTNVILVNYMEMNPHYTSTSDHIYSNLDEMYEIKNMYKEIKI